MTRVAKRRGPMGTAERGRAGQGEPALFTFTTATPAGASTGERAAAATRYQGGPRR